MKNVSLNKFEIFVDGKLRFIKNTIREKDTITKLLKQKGISFEVKEYNLY